MQVRFQACFSASGSVTLRINDTGWQPAGEKPPDAAIQLAV
jgi:hypothetical protein